MKVKKLAAVSLAAAMAFSAAACGSSSSESGESKPDVAFVTDAGTVSDQSFDQDSWAGVQAFASDNELSAKYYSPSENSDAARTAQIDNAVKDGSKVVVMTGGIFASSLAEAQEKYPEVSFLALDAGTEDLENPASNTALVTYKEEQAGFLAGFAAVKDGYRELAFLGETDAPAVIRYGYGFVQGAEAAAMEEGVSDVHIKYWYSDVSVSEDDIRDRVDGWYSDPDHRTEMLFACGSSVCASCLEVVQEYDGRMIGSDVDRSGLDSCVVTSAAKSFSKSVQRILKDCMDNGWKFSSLYAGKESRLGVAEDGVGLPMKTSRFNIFTEADYDSLCEGIADGVFVIDDGCDPEARPAVSAVTVDYQA